MKLYEERERQRPADYFADWKEREALAEGMIPLVGKLYRKNNVKTYESSTVSNMYITINGRTTNVHSNFIVSNRFK